MKIVIPGDEIGLRVSECIVANGMINQQLLTTFLLVYFYK